MFHTTDQKLHEEEPEDDLAGGEFAFWGKGENFRYLE